MTWMDSISKWLVGSSKSNKSGCCNKPKLHFQFAKLKLEAKLQEQSEISYTIVRPTAFFKSLSGQIDRVLAGKPFLIFGNGELTRCKPISDADLILVLDAGTIAEIRRVFPMHPLTLSGLDDMIAGLRKPREPRRRTHVARLAQKAAY